MQIFNQPGPDPYLFATPTYTYTSAAKTIGAGSQLCALTFSIFNGPNLGIEQDKPYSVVVTIKKAVAGTLLHTFNSVFSANFPTHYAEAYNWVTPSFGNVSQSVIVTVTINCLDGGVFGVGTRYDYISMTIASAI